MIEWIAFWLLPNGQGTGWPHWEAAQDASQAVGGIASMG